MSAASALGWSPWLWPIAAIAAVAVGGAVRGTAGAIAGFGFFLTFACLLVALDLRRSDGLRVAVIMVAIGSAAVLLVVALMHGPTRSTVVEAGPVDLRGKSLTQRMVDKIELRGALLAGASLTGLDLRRNSLAGALAPGVLLVNARLDGVDLRGADLRGADLTGACLDGADLAGALLYGANIEGADLGAVTIPRREAKSLIGRAAQKGHPPAHCR